MLTESYEEVTLLSDGTSERHGFRLIKKEEDLVYKVLFKREETLKDISEFTESIPDTAKEALEAFLEWRKPEHYRIIIRSPETAAPDPVMYVQTGEMGTFSGGTQYFSANQTYIVCRWGEALRDFKIMAKEALENTRAALIKKLSLNSKRINMELSAIKDGDLSDFDILQKGAQDYYGNYQSLL